MNKPKESQLKSGSAGMWTQVSQLLVPAQSPFLHSGCWKNRKARGSTKRTDK